MPILPLLIFGLPLLVIYWCWRVEECKQRVRRVELLKAYFADT